ncbi:hypothetical protein [Streptomyces sp. NPDC001401]|uniref:hypothetical protein n=1 Tax=Streptomyces sp. NPDC001401 TaxID=3364570 RepID=UPI0036C1E803
MSGYSAAPQDADGQGAMKAFVERLDSLVVRTEGTSEVDWDALIELIRQEPELSVITCRALGSLAIDRVGSWHAYGQLATVIAWAYDAAFEDDVLSAWVAGELEAGKVDMRSPRLARQVAEDSHEEAQTVVMAVSRDLLAAGDVYPFVLAFSHHEFRHGTERMAELRSMRGRLVITFDIPLDDPREVWEFPEVRAYANKLADHLPYLPYYFDQGPQFAMMRLWLCCLAPPSAWTQAGLDLRDKSVMVHGAYAMYTTEGLAELLGEDPHEVRATVFGSLPEDFVAHISDVADAFAADQNGSAGTDG